MDGGEIPRCRHGRILLGCPDDTCPEQSAYLERQQAKIDAYLERQALDARAMVREALGLAGKVS